VTAYAVAFALWIGAIVALGVSAAGFLESTGLLVVSAVLSGFAIVAAVIAVAIGIVGAVVFDPWIAAFVAAGAFIVVTYNLESFGGRFHDDAWFALAWGSFPLLTAYFATAESIVSAAATAEDALRGLIELRARQSRTAYRVTAAFIQRFEGPVNDLIAPIDHTLADTQIGVAVGIMIWMRRNPFGQRLVASGLALILGGALGNVIDRVRLGHVTDFVDFHIDDWHFAAFNVADAAITVGAGLLILDMFLEWRRTRASKDVVGEGPLP